MIRNAAKRLVIGTRLERPVRRIHHALTGSRNSLYDLQTISILERVLRPDSNAIDIGCFEGGMLRHFLRLAPRGRHIAFEPLPDRFERLRRRFPRDRVAIHPYAIAEHACEASFTRVVRLPALSGLLPRIDLPPGEPVEELRVRVETLDRVVPPDFPVALVKIDVEGSELGVLRGGIETLRRTRPIVVFECGRGGADSYGSVPGAIHDVVVETIGLRVSRMEDWLEGRPPLSRAEFSDEFTRGAEFYFVAHPPRPERAPSA